MPPGLAGLKSGPSVWLPPERLATTAGAVLGQLPAATAFSAAAAASVPITRWLNTNRWRHHDEPGATQVRPWVAALFVGVAAAVVAQLATPAWWPAAVAAFLLTMAGYPAAVIDRAVHRVPEPLVLTCYGAIGATLTVSAALTGMWASLWRAAACAACAAILWVGFFLYALLGSMGFADVQLIGLVGLVLGWISWQAALMSGPIVLAVGGLWAVGLLAAGRRGHFPFAPAVFLGALTTLTLYT